MGYYKIYNNNNPYNLYPRNKLEKERRSERIL